MEESVSTGRYTKEYGCMHGHPQTHRDMIMNPQAHRGKIPCQRCKYMHVHTMSQAQTHTGMCTQLCHGPRDHKFMYMQACRLQRRSPPRHRGSLGPWNPQG